MYEFHGNKEYYFQMQYWISRDYILPIAKKYVPLQTVDRVLEVGCAEAGVLKAFVENGNNVVGIDLSETRIALATQFQKAAIERGQLTLLTKNIFDLHIEQDLGGKFDLIILKDVIEHIPDQLNFIKKLQSFLKPEGCIFFGFPPWYMPFGGHQQLSRSIIIKRLPWIHLLPVRMYRYILNSMGDPKPVVDEFLEIKATGITIERFEKIVKKLSLKILYREFYLTNPIYTYKFNIPCIKVNKWFGSIPWLRNFYTTGVYYILRSS